MGVVFSKKSFDTPVKSPRPPLGYIIPVALQLMKHTDGSAQQKKIGNWLQNLPTSVMKTKGSFSLVLGMFADNSSWSPPCFTITLDDNLSVWATWAIMTSGEVCDSDGSNCTVFLFIWYHNDIPKHARFRGGSPMSSAIHWTGKLEWNSAMTFHHAGYKPSINIYSLGEVSSISNESIIFTS